MFIILGILIGYVIAWCMNIYFNYQKERSEKK